METTVYPDEAVIVDRLKEKYPWFARILTGLGDMETEAIYSLGEDEDIPKLQQVALTKSVKSLKKSLGRIAADLAQAQGWRWVGDRDE